MGKFGWSLPPGVTSGMIDTFFGGGDGPCGVCGEVVDDCICPECPECGGVGDPTCYEQHGLVRTAAQLAGFTAMRTARLAEIAVERAMYEQMYVEEMYFDAVSTHDFANAIGWAARHASRNA